MEEVLLEIDEAKAQTVSVQPIARAETGAPAQEMLHPHCDGTMTGTKLTETEMTVQIGGAPEKITKRFVHAYDMADVFGIDVTFVSEFDKNAVIEKVVQGPSEFEGKWNISTVMKAFAPRMYSNPDNAKKALLKTNIADYPSRMEMKMAHNNVSLLNFLYQ